MAFTLAAIAHIAHNLILPEIEKGDRPFCVRGVIISRFLLNLVAHRVVTHKLSYDEQIW
jgi:hypothetical protein